MDIFKKLKDSVNENILTGYRVSYGIENGRVVIRGERSGDVLRVMASAGYSYARRGECEAWDVYGGSVLVACVLGSPGFAYAFTTAG